MKMMMPAKMWPSSQKQTKH